MHRPAQIRPDAILGAREFADSHDDRLIGGDAAEAVLIRPQRIGQHKGIAAVVLRTSHRVPIAKAIELFGIDAEQSPPMFQESLDHGAAGNSIATAIRSTWPATNSSIHAMKSRMACPQCSIFRCSTSCPCESIMQA